MYKQSKRTYVNRRKTRVRELFIEEGREPRDIAAVMVTEGTLITSDESLDSAYRIVCQDVAEIRGEINKFRSGDTDRSLASNELDALERQLERLRADHAWQIAKSEDDSTVTHVMVTPNGEMGIQKFNWPPGVRQKARKDAGILADKISAIEMLLISRRDEQAEAIEGGTGDKLHLIESDKSIPELIEANLIVGTFGKKKKADGSNGGSATG